MNRSKHRMAVIAAVALLGLVFPGAFGGSVLADSSPDSNPITFTLHCDLDGNAGRYTKYVASHYETTYNFVSTDGEKSFHDENSHTWFTQQERVDVPQVNYLRLTGPGGQPDPDPSKSFVDYTVEWFDVYFAPDVYSHGKPKGNTVRCINIADPYEYTIPPEEAALDVEKRLVAGATYIETDYQLFEIGLRGSSGQHDDRDRGHGRNGNPQPHKHRDKH